jgi:hypothetical protein
MPLLAAPVVFASSPAVCSTIALDSAPGARRFAFRVPAAFDEEDPGGA